MWRATLIKAAKVSVRENLMMVPGNQSGEALTNNWLNADKVQAEEEGIGEKADEVIEFIGISHLRNEYAGNLSGGQKKLLELGRTMMVEAKVVFLDEVGAGVNRTLLGTIGKAIKRLRDERGYTFCMIEHDMDFISDLCDPVIVMAEGQIIAEGPASEIMDNQLVVEAYLGTGLKEKAMVENRIRSPHLEAE